MPKSISLRQVERFIRRDLKHRLSNDILETQMLREADLQACVYTHIRRFLKYDDRWRVFSCRYVKRLRAFLDLLIYYNCAPVIAMELKWKRHRISGKDRRSLNRALEELHLNKVYFLTTAEKKSSFMKLGCRKHAAERYHLHELVVVPNCSPAEINRLRAERRRYRTYAA